VQNGGRKFRGGVGGVGGIGVFQDRSMQVDPGRRFGLFSLTQGHGNADRRTLAVLGTLVMIGSAQHNLHRSSMRVLPLLNVRSSNCRYV